MCSALFLPLRYCLKSIQIRLGCKLHWHSRISYGSSRSSSNHRSFDLCEEITTTTLSKETTWRTGYFLIFLDIYTHTLKHTSPLGSRARLYLLHWILCIFFISHWYTLQETHIESKQFEYILNEEWQRKARTRLSEKERERNKDNLSGIFNIRNTFSEAALSELQKKTHTWTYYNDDNNNSNVDDKKNHVNKKVQKEKTEK